MADQKISQLPTITGANMADNDKFVLVDTSGDATVATTRAEFFKSVPDVTFGDNDKAIFGAGSDLQIYHSGTNSFIDDAGTGNLQIRASSQIKLQKYTGENMFVGIADGAASMYYDNAQKIATTATGINVTGTVTSDSLRVDGALGDILLNLVSDTAALRIQETTANEMEILTPAGNDSLALRANSGGAITLRSGGNNDRLNIASNGDISFYEATGTTPKFFWDSSAERLGIGTTIFPGVNNKLSIQGTGGSSGSSTNTVADDVFIDNNGDTGITLGSSATGVGTYAFADSTVALRGAIQYDHSDDSMNFRVSSADRMRIDSDGNVGIGTDDPDRNLDVVSAENVLYGPTVRASEGVNHRLFNTTNATSRYAGITLASNNSAGTTSEFTLSNVSTSSNYQGVLTLQARTGASTYAERLRVDKSGNVSIGKTNVLISAVGIHFTPDGTVSATKDGAIPLVLNRVATGSNNPNGVIAQFKRETVTVGNISVSDGATAFNTSSDYRLKENVVELTSASERVNQLRPSRFNWISDDTNTVIDGFIAHEVATVVPEAITGAKDAMIDEEYEVTPEVLDEDGNVTTEAVMGTRSVPDYQGIDQSKLVPLLTAALKEALAEIASLKTRVEALEG